MRVDTYLMFNGNCAEAFKFYEQLLGGKIAGMMKFSEAPGPDQGAPEWKDKIMHARIELENQALMGSDAPPDRYKGTSGFYVSISVNDKAEGERIFKALSDGGQVHMPFQSTFWSPGFGMLADRFGIPWMVNTESPEHSAQVIPDDVARRGVICDGSLRKNRACMPECWVKDPY